MSIYFVKAQGLIKIGYSADPRRRIQAVLTPFKEGGDVLAVMPGDRELEAFIHTKFAAHRSHGEWFKPCEEIEAFLKLIDAPTAPGAPDKVDDRTLLETYEEKYAEDCADCLRAVVKSVNESVEFCFETIATSTGIAAERLHQIYEGRAGVISSAEYTIVRAHGAQVGHEPSLMMDARPLGSYKGRN